MQFRQNISQSLEAIRANWLRAGVTIFIIALGITALVGVLTSIDGIREGMVSSFSRMGTNTLSIKNWSSDLQAGNQRGRRRKYYPPVTFREYKEFKEKFSSLSIVGGEGFGGSALTAKYLDRETNQDIRLRGIDENYMKTARYEITEGRGIIEDDLNLARNLAVIGDEVKQRLFPNESPIGKIVTIKKHKYKIVGVYDKVGSTSMGGQDKVVTVPLSTLRNHESYLGSLTINLFVDDPLQLEYITEEATGTFRLVRDLRPTEDNDFAVIRSDSFVDQAMDSLQVLTVSAQIIALITLLGASVALLNVMLVSVTERTNEIGLRKALGATKRTIRMQFLFEAITICQLGGLLGIVLGLLAGNLVSTLLLKGDFVIPWFWLIVGVISCFVVGVFSGLYPAIKASNVDPIESLRHV
ncbi:MAG: ABC transporter permease [Bacteroidota bacterium]